jgi:pimeloyl-ACP methyl ester carboxylesterase
VPSVKARGLEIAYDRAGGGPPIVFVHGGFDDAAVWQSQLTGLSGEFDVVAWDEPGVGRSEIPPPGFGLHDYADCLADLIRELAVAPAHVLGLSWGGTVVLELYRRHADVVRTLLLADTYAGWKGSLPPEEVSARVADVQAQMEDVPAGPRRDTLAGQLQAMATADQTDLLPQINVPTLLIWGDRDPRSPLDVVARQFEEAIPGAELVVIPDAGHMSNLDQPQAFNEAIRSFLRALPEPR